MKLKKVFFLAVCALVLWPAVNSALALCLGILFGIFLGNPFGRSLKKVSGEILTTSVVFLGFGMNLAVVLTAGKDAFFMTLIGIVVTLAVGLFLGRILQTDRDASILVSVGTAICGGSAIAAASQAMNAKEDSTSVALATVFLLNAIALVLFPSIGSWLGFSEDAFGVWAAISIHDTSSVVGAGMQYGQRALEVATTTKLVRALWIIPVTLLVGVLYSKKNAAGKAPFPWFIVRFLIASALVTTFPQLQEAGKVLSEIGKRGLVLALFLIGSNISVSSLKTVGSKTLAQGVGLWIFVSVVSALCLKYLPHFL